MATNNSETETVLPCAECYGVRRRCLCLGYMQAILDVRLWRDFKKAKNGLLADYKRWQSSKIENMIANRHLSSFLRDVMSDRLRNIAL